MAAPSAVAAMATLGAESGPKGPRNRPRPDG